jgi:hypothetical protein
MFFVCFFLKKEVAQGGEQTRVLSIHLFSHVHHITAEPQRLPKYLVMFK